ncbi:MAG: hypothetical protein ACI4QR_05300, partial [Eubacteriales bacterium]
IDAIVIVDVFVNDRIQSDDWLRGSFKDDVPVLTVIPDMTAKHGGKYGYGYGKYGKYGYYGTGKKS